MNRYSFAIVLFVAMIFSVSLAIAGEAEKIYEWRQKIEGRVVNIRSMNNDGKEPYTVLVKAENGKEQSFVFPGRPSFGIGQLIIWQEKEEEVEVK